MAEFQAHPSSIGLERDRKGTGALGHCYFHVTRRPGEGVCDIKLWSNSGTGLDKVHPPQPQVSLSPACRV